MNRWSGRRALAVTLLLGLAAPACRPAGEPDRPTVTVYAAASTATFITDFALAYEKRTGVRVRCSFAASSTLARQIEHGAPADVFVAAHPQWMDHLEAANLIAPGSRRDLLANRLVLAVPADAPPAEVVDIGIGSDFDFAAAWPGRIATGHPDHVPLGMYARQALRALGWWEEIEPRLVPTVDARAAVRLVEMGEVAGAIVYLSDALASDDIVVAAHFAPGSHDPIRYPAALRNGADAAASDFLLALTAPATESLRTSFGFTIPP